MPRSPSIRPRLTAAILALSMFAPVAAYAADRALSAPSTFLLTAPLHGEFLAIVKGGIPAKRRRKFLMEAGLKEQEAQRREPIEEDTGETEGENAQEEVMPPPSEPTPAESEEEPLELQQSPEGRFEERVCTRVLEHFSGHPVYLEATNRRLLKRWGFGCQ